MVFGEHEMKQRLPDDIFDALQRTIQNGSQLAPGIAEAVAGAMKAWAVEKGATHFTHWFQPMTGITAEKHESFISPADNGRIILEFSGSNLVRGEPDASSFPSGGLRATFEARGYTAWDPTSYAFVKGNTLYIPTAFCSYGGLALDEKTPLLRSMQTLGEQALRILRLFGNETAASVKPTVGAEQEYFLVDENVYRKRKDLMYTGRTLFGAKSPKGQELDDQYYGSMKTRVTSFMKALDEELWRLGIPAKTEHNEAAPAQHELAPIFATANIATDHNQLTMELMQRIAKEHGMICLLHEKPFEGINGSGKHNNWSLTTNDGANLVDPGSTPQTNAQFLLFLAAVIKAVDEYQDLLRISVASAGNDQRLGGNEAPPAIVSVYLGDELTSILDAIVSGKPYDAREKSVMKVGVTVLPRFPKDTTDRNRTSPFAFTGNKFEFRMVGSAMSISEANIVLNTTVAESLRQFADCLESADDWPSALHELIRDTIIKHKRIIFNGNGYGEEWVKEAKRRGLLNLRTTPDALPYLLHEKNVKLFERHGVFSEAELRARHDIRLENYCKVVNIEAVTMYKLTKKNIMFAVASYMKDLSDAALKKREFLGDISCEFETDTVRRLSELSDSLYRGTVKLYNALCAAADVSDVQQRALFYKESVLAIMDEMRLAADEMELTVSRSYWPFSTYGDLLFSVS
ncbi:MAG: glutamine synthetase III [Oscillospiraceae bacterium]|nr:glutamine synthetase III [Oscillospiraceae bacterium]